MLSRIFTTRSFCALIALSLPLMATTGETVPPVGMSIREALDLPKLLSPKGVGEDTGSSSPALKPRLINASRLRFGDILRRGKVVNGSCSFPASVVFMQIPAKGQAVRMKTAVNRKSCMEVVAEFTVTKAPENPHPPALSLDLRRENAGFPAMVSLLSSSVMLFARVNPVKPVGLVEPTMRRRWDPDGNQNAEARLIIVGGGEAAGAVWTYMAWDYIASFPFLAATTSQGGNCAAGAAFNFMYSVSATFLPLGSFAGDAEKIWNINACNFTDNQFDGFGLTVGVIGTFSGDFMSYTAEVVDQIGSEDFFNATSNCVWENPDLPVGLSISLYSFDCIQY